MSDRLQRQRYEFKYWLDEAKARRVRQFVQNHLRVDEFSSRQPDLSYPTLSPLSRFPSVANYWQTVCSDKNRFKLRLRYYDDQPDSPVFFEIKRREDNVILSNAPQSGKARCADVDRAILPEPKHLLNPRDGNAVVALQRFCHHVASFARGSEDARCLPARGLRRPGR